jgi:hypothetical protein
MVIVIDCGGSIHAYLASGPDVVLVRPTVCPGCGAEHALIGHGFYPRKPLDIYTAHLIQIRRWYCKACHHTLSQLPSFLLRFRHYLLEVIQSVLVARYEQRGSYGQVARHCGPQGAPARSTIRRWCRSFAAQASSWLSEIEQVLAQQDPVTPLLDAHGQSSQPLDTPQAVLAASLHLLAWAKTQYAELSEYGLPERMRFLWHWGHARGLTRLV